VDGESISEVISNPFLPPKLFVNKVSEADTELPDG
jgi:hypothetical protein